MYLDLVSWTQEPDQSDSWMNYDQTRKDANQKNLFQMDDFNYDFCDIYGMFHILNLHSL